MDPSEVPKDSIAFEVADWILRSWRFKWLEVFRGAFCCCEYFFVFFCFCLNLYLTQKLVTLISLEVFRLQTSDLSILKGERFP